MTKLLLDHRANLNATKDDGETPLKTALANGHQDVADRLRASGAKEE